jgi:hypothetical protein
MVVVNIKNLSGCDTTNKAYIAFEKQGGAGVNGIYFNEFDKTSTAIQNPDDAFNNATKIIDANDYQNLSIRNIWLYANRDGSDLTITILTEPVANNMLMFTGRIVNNRYISCDGGNAKQINANFLRGFFAFYYNDDTKNKFYLYQDAAGQFVADGEAH